MKIFYLLSFFSISAFSLDIRIVAVGDIHGDYSRAVRLLQNVRLIDKRLNWIGGRSILVQTGDQIDRWYNDRKVIDLFTDLQFKAEKKGGKVYPLLGNHEIMNVDWKFKYVLFKQEWTDFNEFASESLGNILKKDEAYKNGRMFAFFPDGPYARILATRKSILKLHNILFLHGGLLPNYAEMGIDRINMEVSNWMNNEGEKPAWFKDRKSNPFWSRHFSDGVPSRENCNLLYQTLKITGTNLMVVGHSVQDNGITWACQKMVFRIDTGISGYFGGPLQALEIMVSPDSRIKSTTILR